jgi:transposase
MVLDGADWRRSKALKISKNIYPLSLPPYSPELNPVERLWDEIREKGFHNRVFSSLDTLEDHLADELLKLENAPRTVQSITSWPWIVNTLLT